MTVTIEMIYTGLRSFLYQSYMHINLSRIRIYIKMKYEKLICSDEIYT